MWIYNDTNKSLNFFKNTQTLLFPKDSFKILQNIEIFGIRGSKSWVKDSSCTFVKQPHLENYPDYAPRTSAVSRQINKLLWANKTAFAQTWRFSECEASRGNGREASSITWITSVFCAVYLLDYYFKLPGS